MYSSNTSEHQKSSSPTPSAPPDPFRQAPAIGIHVKPVHQFPNDNSHAAHPIHPQANTIPWSSGLCDCGADVPNCCMTCWCPCITFGQISDIVDKGSQSCVANGAIYAAIMYFTGCCCIYSCLYRSKLRKQYSLMESPCSDCLVHCCCQTCALCQEYRELKSRGFDMTIGWEGNMERQNHGVALAPIVHGGMNR